MFENSYLNAYVPRIKRNIRTLCLLRLFLNIYTINLEGSLRKVESFWGIKFYIRSGQRTEAGPFTSPSFPFLFHLVDYNLFFLKSHPPFCSTISYSFPWTISTIWPVEDNFPLLKKKCGNWWVEEEDDNNYDSELCLEDRSHWASWQTLGRGLCSEQEIWNN